MPQVPVASGRGQKGKMGEAVLLPVSEVICEQFMKAWAVQKQGLLRFAEVEVALQSLPVSALGF